MRNCYGYFAVIYSQTCSRRAIFKAPFLETEFASSSHAQVGEGGDVVAFLRMLCNLKRKHS